MILFRFQILLKSLGIAPDNIVDPRSIEEGMPSVRYFGNTAWVNLNPVGIIAW
ncbi:hypothetical protein GYM62_18960 [Algoriphagus sp. NBT04N3]|uniref:hypothetical protein n=1 Tax=Algoriphagus sp. NBT04N3 TaxID=2705473 RepID=UPI001C631BC0|nr:hypothetical protein [Algoriphagus sp. NBT04N3]QYH40777.1 hypothetical protein GYM62_18960 [Algoriphagus sp. NBT04N3]